MYHQELETEGQTKIGARLRLVRNWVLILERYIIGSASKNPNLQLRRWYLKEAKDQELAALRKENAQLKEANEILRLASAFSPRRSSTANKSSS